jgi:hypothetical protein
MACLTCLTGSIVTTALALPYYADALRPARFIARFILASIFSLALTVLIAVVAFTIITALHHSVVRLREAQLAKHRHYAQNPSMTVIDWLR